MYDFENMDKKLIVFGYLFRVANRLQHNMDLEMKDLTAKQWFVILALGLFDEPPTLKQLAAACDSSHQNTKQLVLKLKEKGFVSVEHDKADGRAMRIAATRKCDQWDQENEQYANRFLKQMFHGFTNDEIAALCSSLMKLFDNLGSPA